MKASYIDITGLKVFARVGVAEAERRIGNRFEISARLHYDASEAMRTDDIGAALNYADVTRVIVGECASEAMLIENLAWRIRQAVAAAFPQITAGSLTVTKLHPPIPAPTPTVSFTCEW